MKVIFDRAVPQHILSPNYTEFCTEWFPAGQVRVELTGVGCLCSQLCSNYELGEGIPHEDVFGHQKPKQSQAELYSSCEFTAFPIVSAKQKLLVFFYKCKFKLRQ